MKLTQVYLEGTSPKGYDFYTAKNDDSWNFTDIHFQRCLDLMTKYNLHENLGISLFDLVSLTYDRELYLIEKHMIKTIETKKSLADQLGGEFKK